MSCFILLCSLDHCLCDTFSSWECLSLYFTSSSPLSLFRKAVFLCDNCLVYSTSLVSNNYLGSNNCSVENNFHLTSECLVSYCSAVWTTVCVKHLSSYECLSLRFTSFSPLFLFRKAVLCAITVLYTVPL